MGPGPISCAVRVWHHGAFAQVKFAPRMVVEQGTKPDGSIKVRAVDHMSWFSSGGNGKKRHVLFARIAQVLVMGQVLVYIGPEER